MGHFITSENRWSVSFRKSTSSSMLNFRVGHKRSFWVYRASQAVGKFEEVALPPLAVGVSGSHEADLRNRGLANLKPAEISW